MLGIRLFCRSKTTKYFDAEIACLHGFTVKASSVLDIKLIYHLYEISAFSLDKIWYFVSAKEKHSTVRFINQIYFSENKVKLFVLP